MSYVCGKCLADHDLARVVARHAESNECDYCKKTDSTFFSASLDTVIEHMEECISREYVDPAEELPYESAEGGYQGKVLNAWELLDEVGFSPESDDLIKEVRDAFSGHDWCRDNYFILSPTERKQHGWERFKSAVKHQRRFTFWSMGDDMEEEGYPDYLPVGHMLAEIGEGILKVQLVKPLPKGSTFWRVRVHSSATVVETDRDLSPPPLDCAIRSNRMSPAGVSMFYGAEDFDTAYVETVHFAEDREKSVTGACFTTVKPLYVLDLIGMPVVPGFFDLEHADERSNLEFLHQFVHDLAKPINHDGREHIEYVPTQAFTEYLRFVFALPDKSTVNGIRYPSSHNQRSCIVLFCGQEDCVEKIGHRRGERWMEWNRDSLRKEKVSTMVPMLLEPARPPSEEPLPND